MDKIKAGILGATGNVGQRFIQQLYNHPWFEITSLAASDKSVGKKYNQAANWRLEEEIPDEISEMEVVAVDPKKIDADIVFSALPANLAKTIEPEFAKSGFVVASNASAFRKEKDVPLIIPEVNSEHLGLIDIQQDSRKWDGYIITNPNCTTIIMTVTLKPLMKFKINKIYIASMQALSGAGYDGVPSMAIVDNVLPYINSEEEKVETETKKLLGEFNGSEVIDADIDISASCHRVNVLDGHTEAIWVEMEDNPTPEEVKKEFLNFDPKLSELPTEPVPVINVMNQVDRPQPRMDRNKGNGMTVSVGRIRPGIRYICVGHNTIRGAAGASVLNAELLKIKRRL